MNHPLSTTKSAERARRRTLARRIAREAAKESSRDLAGLVRAARSRSVDAMLAAVWPEMGRQGREW